MKQETFFVLDCDEFDQLVKATFPNKRGFEFVEAKEAAKDADYAFMNILARDSWDTDESIQKAEDNLKKWANNEKVYGIGCYQILAGLVRRGVLEPGNYLVQA